MLLLLVPLVVLPLASVVVLIASEVRARMAKPAESAPETIDPVVMLQGTALADQLRAELGSTDDSVGRFVDAVAAAKLQAIVAGDAPCDRDELGQAALTVPASANDNVSYRVRVSAPGEQVDPGSLAGLAVDVGHAITKFREHPTGWNLDRMRRFALQLHTIVFVVGVRTPAGDPQFSEQRDGQAYFEPGTVRGTAYVYSARERRIRCAGAIDVRNRDTVRFGYHFDAFSGIEARSAAERALAEDLDYEMIDAVITSLRVVPSRR